MRCKHCGREIVRSTTGRWVHAHNLTAGCNYGKTKAEPK